MKDEAAKDRQPALLDVVALLADLPAQGLPRGQVGTVVEPLDDKTVLVEFTDDQGRAYQSRHARAQNFWCCITCRRRRERWASQFENVRTLRALAEKRANQGNLSQFLRPGITQEWKKILVGSEGWLPPAEFLGFAPRDELKEPISLT